MSDATAKIILSADDRTAAAFASVKNSLSTFNAQAVATNSALGALGASLTFAGMAQFVKSTNDGVDALNDLKDATGSSIENISALEDVADRTGTSLDTVGSALTKFNMALKDAKPDSGVAQALKQIGLNAADLKKQDPAEALLKTAQALTAFADDGNKARLVQELFGKSTRELAPFLKDLAEKGKLVATVTTEQAEESEKFNKQLFEMEKNTKDLGRALVSDLVTGINAAAKAFRESGLVASIQTLLTGTDQFKNDKRLVELTNELLTAENALAASRGRDAKFGDKSLVTAAEEKRLARIKEELKTVQAFRTVQEQGNAAAIAPKPSVGDLVDPKGKGKPKAEEIDEARRSLASYVQALQGNLNTVEKLTETEKALNFLRGLGTRGEIPQVRELVLGLAEQIDKEKELVNVMQLKRAESIAAGDEVNRANAERQQGLKALLDATPNANLERQRADVKLLTEEFEAGRISEQQYLEAATARLSLAGDQLKETTSLAKDLGLTFSSSFEEAITSAKSFSDVLKGLAQDVLKIAVRKTITEPLGNALNSTFSSIGSSLAEAFGFGGAAASAVASVSAVGTGLTGFGGFYANGGNPPMGKVSIVGERGPELFVPSVPGTIIPNGAMGGQRDGDTYNFYGGMNRNEVISAMQTVRAQARDDRIEDGRRRR